MKLRILGLSFSILLIMFSFDIQSAHAADLQEWMKKYGVSYVYIEYPDPDINGQWPYLTENQARTILLEEAKKAGIDFTLLHGVTFDEYYFFNQLNSTTFEMFYSSFMYTDLFDRIAIENSNIPDPLLSYRNDMVFYPSETWDSVYKWKPYTNWQPTSLNPQYFVDAVNLKLKIACAYLSEEEYATFLLGSPEVLGDSLKEELQHQYTPYFFGIFTSCDEDTLRFQVQCFFAWWKNKLAEKFLTDNY